MPRDEFLTIFRRSTEIHRQLPMKGRLIHRAVPPSNFECCPTFSYFFSSSLLLIKELRLSSRAAFSILGEKEDSWKKNDRFPSKRGYSTR